MGGNLGRVKPPSCIEPLRFLCVFLFSVLVFFLYSWDQFDGVMVDGWEGMCGKFFFFVCFW